MLVQYECENVLNDAALMEACGVGLSRTDMYGVMMVCKQLGEDPKLGVATVRFFGKVVIQIQAQMTGSRSPLHAVRVLILTLSVLHLSNLMHHCTVDQPQCTFCSACWHHILLHNPSN